MLIAASKGKDGRKLLLIGLERENIERLLNDMPILKTLDGTTDVDTEPGPLIEGLEGWSLVIMGPEDMARFVAHFGV